MTYFNSRQYGQNRVFNTNNHYAQIDAIAKREIEAEKRSKRYKIIHEEKLEVDALFTLPDGTKATIVSINKDGILSIDNGNKIDLVEK